MVYILFTYSVLIDVNLTRCKITKACLLGINYEFDNDR